MKIFYAIGTALLLSACISPPQSAKADADALQVVAQPVTASSTPLPVKEPTPALIRVAAASTAGSFAARADVQAFIAEMVSKHGFQHAELEAVFTQAKLRPDIIAAMTRPAEGKPWYAYRKIFLTGKTH